MNYNGTKIEINNEQIHFFPTDDGVKILKNGNVEDYLDTLNSENRLEVLDEIIKHIEDQVENQKFIDFFSVLLIILNFLLLYPVIWFIKFSIALLAFSPFFGCGFLTIGILGSMVGVTTLCFGINSLFEKKYMKKILKLVIKEREKLQNELDNKKEKLEVEEYETKIELEDSYELINDIENSLSSIDFKKAELKKLKSIFNDFRNASDDQNKPIPQIENGNSRSKRKKC